MRSGKHVTKRVTGLKILKIVIILAITFLAGIIVTFCQKQNKTVVTDENRVSQVTSGKPKKHKKAAAAKKETGKETKISDNINTVPDSSASKSSENETARIERAKKALDKYCKGEYITGQEAKDLDWYCKKYRINPQPAEGDHYEGQTKYDDQEPAEDNYDYSGDTDAAYNVGSNYGENGQAEDNSSEQTTVAENNQSAGNGNNNCQGGGNYGNN